MVWAEYLERTSSGDEIKTAYYGPRVRNRDTLVSGSSRLLPDAFANARPHRPADEGHAVRRSLIGLDGIRIEVDLPPVDAAGVAVVQRLAESLVPALLHLEVEFA